eukprot:TRINITY_DN11601_c0_g1_i4.p3 TRINITY_DN11601_c0_g1~~TRINITY_DN11601_c0_g1_i4.p3  ORF type:complete len:191 (+),score=18.01 TRINITY_DN11601_c0_g1_i4:3978-4550(+)
MLLRVLEQLNSRRIILASGSPRRKEILETIGLNFEIIKSTFDEKSLDKASYATPYDFVKDNALHKAREVASRVLGKGIIIGCDTVVLFNDTILEKPEDDSEAIAMLTTLSNQTHHVASGVAILHRSSTEADWSEVVFHETTAVSFAALDEDEIKAYVATGNSEPSSKHRLLDSLNVIPLNDIRVCRRMYG